MSASTTSPASHENQSREPNGNKPNAADQLMKQPTKAPPVGEGEDQAASDAQCEQEIEQRRVASHAFGILKGGPTPRDQRGVGE